VLAIFAGIFLGDDMAGDDMRGFVRHFVEVKQNIGLIDVA
jgi:hypothetical protein